MFCAFSDCVSVCYCSVLDLNAFERQNKAEGLGMVTEEGSGIDYLKGSPVSASSWDESVINSFFNPERYKLFLSGQHARATQ